MRVRSLYILLLLFYGSFCCRSQDSAQLLRLTMAEGLPSNTIYSLLQDRNGYIWITTDNGLAKYNGYNFRLFGAKEGLPQDMFGMFEDANRRLWIDYYGYNLGYIKNNKVRFIDYKFTKNTITGFRVISRSGRVFFQSDEGLVEIDSTDALIRYPSPLGKGRYFKHPVRGKFLHTDGRTLSECSLINGELQCKHLCDLPGEMGKAQLIQRNVTDSGFLGYAPGAGFLQYFNIYTCAYQKVFLTDLGGSESEGIRLFYRIGPDIFVISNEAVYVLDLRLRLRERKSDHNTIPGLSQVSFFLRDSSTNEWYATTADGLLMRPGVPPLFRANKKLTDLAQSINVGVAPSGNSYWWNSKQKKLVAITPQLSVKYSISFPKADVQAVLEHGNELFIAFTQSSFNGVYVYDIAQRQQNNFTTNRYVTLITHSDSNVTTELKGFDNTVLSNVFNLHEYKPGTFFTTLRGSGIAGIVRTNDSVTINYFLYDRYPNMVYDSSNKKYWLFNNERLMLFDPETSKTATLPIEQLKKLNITTIYQIQFDKHNNVYILTDKLIYQFNMRSFRFRYIRPNVDLTNVHMQIQGDYLFIAGNFGFGYAGLPNSNGRLPFTIFQNVRENYYNRIYDLLINSAGNVVLTTDKAAYTFSINSLNTARAKAQQRRHFTQMVIGYPDHRAIHTSDTVRVPRETEMLSFDMINFNGSGPRIYTYNIEGHGDWNTTEAGEVFIGDLEPGKFHKFRCYVNDDIWQSETYTFYVYRLPYWYQTSTWRIAFWIIGILLLSLLVTAIVLVTRNIVARSNEKRQLLTELELRAIHAQINPHFIFNTLSSAMYFISKRKTDDAYLHVNKFSRLLRSYLKSSRNRYITLSEELDMLKNYIELQQTRFENKFDYEINIENKIAADSVQIPSLLLQPLVENAINHGLFHLPEGKKGLLLIKFYQGSSSDELICTIEDNGVGRRKAREIKRGSDAQYESYGTKLTEELINIFKRYEKMNIYLEYIDKPEPEPGTIVKLTIRNLKYVA